MFNCLRIATEEAEFSVCLSANATNKEEEHIQSFFQEHGEAKCVIYRDVQLIAQYAAKSHGLILHIGHDMCYAVCFANNQVLWNTYCKNECLSESHVTQQLRNFVKQQSELDLNMWEIEMVLMYAYVQDKYVKQAATQVDIEYVCAVDDELHWCMEELFSAGDSIVHLCQSSWQSVNQRHLYNNIFVTGMLSQKKGFVRRLLQELQEVATSGIRLCVTSYAKDLEIELMRCHHSGRSMEHFQKDQQFGDTSTLSFVFSIFQEPKFPFHFCDTYFESA